jgi:hypothetical protein
MTASKLARILTISVALTALSLGGVANAQESADPSQPAGVTQSDPSQSQPPGEPVPQDPGTPADRVTPEDPDTPEDPVTPEDPGKPEDPAAPQDPGTTTTTRPPVVRPKSLPVTVSPRAGGPGTTVTLRADLRGCTRPGSARGFFNEVHEWDTDGLSKWLVSEHVSGGRWYTGRYRITNNIPAGLGRFAVICDNGRPNFIIGFATFQVQPSTSAVPVRVSPQEAARGTTVKITAEVGRCQLIHIWFYDSKTDGLTEAGGAKLITPYRVTDAGTLTASYTLTRKNAVGPARFRVVCGIDDDNGRFGEASFRVLGSTATGTKSTTNRNDGSQVPNRIDTGLGGTADDDGPGGLDPTRLLLPAGLLLIIVGAGLGLRQAARSRR